MAIEPKICVWSDLTTEHLDVIFSASTNENLMSVLADICKMEDTDDVKNQILLEFYFHTIQFAKSKGMNYAQTSSLFTIMKLVHAMCISTPYNNNKTTFTYFKQLLVKHSLQRPPYSVGVFDVSQVQAITDYALNTYFRHFDMYKYAFTPKVRIDISFHYDGIPETPEPIVVAEPTQPEEEQEEVEAETVEEEEPAPELESEEMKQLRDMIQVAMGAELKQLQGRLEKLIIEQDAKISRQVEALEESIGLKSGAKSPAGKKRK
ncbi:hypothetical protein ACHWQZ_G006662 [Mnemiopsis leidyi]